SRRIQRYSREEMKETVLRFAGDFFRLLGVSKIPVQAKEVAGKAQHGFLHFLARVALDSPGELLNGSECQFFGRDLLDDLFHLLQFVLGDQRSAKLLKMQGRAVFIN